jgi:predicted phage terminase large subunit-like protein
MLGLYHLWRYPRAEVVFAQRSLDMAKERTRNTRAALNDPLFRLACPGLQLSRESFGKIDWRLEGKGAGGHLAVGLNSSFTSKGADLLIIDDPYKDYYEALSADFRESVWGWYQDVASTRLSPHSGVLVIHTRWHEDDLIGRLIKRQSGRWRVLNFPAIAVEDDEHRRKGEALSVRFKLDVLEEKRDLMGPRKWAAIYQGNPIASGGNLWKRAWFTKMHAAPEAADIAQRITSWDLTFGSKTATASWVTGQAWVKTKGGEVLLIDEVRGRWSFLEMIEHFRRFARRHPKSRRHLVEDKALAPALFEVLKKEIRGIVSVSPDGSKIARAEAVTPALARGDVGVPVYLPWSKSWLDEAEAFPSGSANDRIDAASQAIRYLKNDRKLRYSYL